MRPITDMSFFFFFNDTATTEIYTLSLHDALPIYFLDQIDFTLDLGAPGRLRAFPRGEERAFRAAVLIDSNGSAAERAETRFNLFVRDVRAHDAKNFGARHAEFFRSALAGINIDNTGE